MAKASHGKQVKQGVGKHGQVGHGGRGADADVAILVRLQSEISLLKTLGWEIRHLRVRGSP